MEKKFCMNKFLHKKNVSLRDGKKIYLIYKTQEYMHYSYPCSEY